MLSKARLLLAYLWTGFYMISTSVMKELSDIVSFHGAHLHTFRINHHLRATTKTWDMRQ